MARGRYDDGVRAAHDPVQEGPVEPQEALLAHDVAVPGDDALHGRGKEGASQMGHRVREMQMHEIVVVHAP